MKEIEQDILNQKKKEIILKNYDEIVRKRLIKHGGIGRVFGFLIKMITDVPINQKRDFMLKYYLDDTNVAIYEYRETNSGESKNTLTDLTDIPIIAQDKFITAFCSPCVANINYN